MNENRQNDQQGAGKQQPSAAEQKSNNPTMPKPRILDEGAISNIFTYAKRWIGAGDTSAIVADLYNLAHTAIDCGKKAEQLNHIRMIVRQHDPKRGDNHLVQAIAQGYRELAESRKRLDEYRSSIFGINNALENFEKGFAVHPTIEKDYATRINDLRILAEQIDSERDHWASQLNAGAGFENRSAHYVAMYLAEQEVYESFPLPLHVRARTYLSNLRARLSEVELLRRELKTTSKLRDNIANNFDDLHAAAIEALTNAYSRGEYRLPANEQAWKALDEAYAQRCLARENKTHQEGAGRQEQANQKALGGEHQFDEQTASNIADGLRREFTYGKARPSSDQLRRAAEGERVEIIGATSETIDDMLQFQLSIQREAKRRNLPHETARVALGAMIARLDMQAEAINHSEEIYKRLDETVRRYAPAISGTTSAHRVERLAQSMQAEVDERNAWLQEISNALIGFGKYEPARGYDDEFQIDSYSSLPRRVSYILKEMDQSLTVAEEAKIKAQETGNSHVFALNKIRNLIEPLLNYTPQFPPDLSYGECVFKMVDAIAQAIQRYAEELKQKIGEVQDAKSLLWSITLPPEWMHDIRQAKTLADAIRVLVAARAAEITEAREQNASDDWREALTILRRVDGVPQQRSLSETADIVAALAAERGRGFSREVWQGIARLLLRRYSIRGAENGLETTEEYLTNWLIDFANQSEVEPLSIACIGCRELVAFIDELRDQMRFADLKQAANIVPDNAIILRPGEHSVSIGDILRKIFAEAAKFQNLPANQKTEVENELCGICGMDLPCPSNHDQEAEPDGKQNI